MTRSQSGSLANPFTYTSREANEAGMLNYRARYYNPGIGRFVSEDPLPIYPNLYRYVLNTPVAAVDPSGMKCCPKNMKIEIVPVNKSVDKGVYSIHFSVKICAEVANSQDCVFTQQAVQTIDSIPGKPPTSDLGFWIVDDPFDVPDIVERSTGKICMKDMPGFPAQGMEVNGQMFWTEALTASMFPINAAAKFITTVRDRQDANDALTKSWGYVMFCSSPTSCAFAWYVH